LIALLCAGIGLLPIVAESFVDRAAGLDLTPEELGVESRKIALVDIPKTFVPKGMVVVEDRQPRVCLLRAVSYEVSEGRGTLAIARIVPNKLSKAQQVGIFRRLQSALHKRGQLRLSFRLLDSKAVAVKVRGRTTEFYLSKGVDVQEKARMWEVRGAFYGEQGPSLFYLRVPNVLMSEREIRDMLKSIR